MRHTLPDHQSHMDTLPSNNELHQCVQSRTYRQVSDLLIERRGERIVLNGRSPTYYVKQLATHAVLDLVPYARVENAIAVPTGW